MNREIVIPTERLVSLDVAGGIAFLAEQDCQNEANSDRGIWRGDATLLFRDGQPMRHFKILPSLALREFTPDSIGKFTKKFDTFLTGPLVRMTPAPNQFIGIEMQSLPWRAAIGIRQVHRLE